MATNAAIGNDVNVDAIDYPSYESTGFNQASGANVLKQEAAKYPVDEASLRAQAEAQYKPTYEIEQRGLASQLSALIKAQADDTDLLNTQYQQSINTMMSKLSKRGLAIGATPTATTAALNRFRNEVMAERQTAYGVQRSGVQSAMDALQANYGLNVQARMFDIKNNSLKTLAELMTQMAQLQTDSFETYVKYLLAKKKSNIQAQSIAIERANLEMDRQSLGIARDKIGLEAASIGIARDKLGLEAQSIAIDRDKLGLDAESIGYDLTRLGYEREGIDIDKKMLKLRYKNSGSSSGGRSSGRSGGSSSSSTDTSGTTGLPSSYFAGSPKKDNNNPGGNTKPGAFNIRTTM